MAFFSLLARCGSFHEAARELELSTAAVSKRLAQMEARLSVLLISRTTRRMSLTTEGELYLQHARRILAQIEDMERDVGGSSAAPRGLLRVNSTLGFGRSHVAPLIAGFVRLHPEVQVQLQLTVDPPALSEDAFDVCVRFGEPPDARVIAHLLAPNRRLLVASPDYLSARGTPRVPQDLTQHNCIAIRQGHEAYGAWRLTAGTGKKALTETVKVRGNLSTCDGEIAINWALEGHGIVLRAEWDVARYLRSGRLQQLLPKYRTPSADIYAVYPQRHQTSTRVGALVSHLASHFGDSARRSEGLIGKW